MAMKPDLQGLEITKGELKRLTGIALRNISAPFWRRVLWLSLWYFSVNYLAIAAFSLLLMALQLALPGSSHLILSLALGISMAVYHRWSWLQKNVSPTLRNLIDDVKQFNSVFKAIRINDQLEEAGNTSLAIKDRDRVLQALWLTREDLVRALKTERILRENEELIATTPALFDNNISALSAMQVGDRATEHGRILNEALEIAMSTQEEMKRLQQSEED
jgi:hypothetical protein